MRLKRIIGRFFGLGRWRPVEARLDPQAALHLRYLNFKELTTSNDEILEVVADLEQRLSSDSLFGMGYVRSRSVTAATHAYRMIQNLNAISNRRYPELLLVFGDIQRAMEKAIERGRAKSEGPLTYPLGKVDLSLIESVGGKSANLGELKNGAKLPVPDGFAISTAAFQAFLEADQLGDDIRARLLSLDVDDLESLDDTSAAIRRLIRRTPLPESLKAAIEGAYRELCSSLGYSPRVALRSSALGEDGELSFAGQYVSLLNVPPPRILDAYREVISGLYTPQAIYYRAVNGIPNEDIPMGVACLAMVEASASGVACSLDPNNPASGNLVINGAWGLGVATVGGSVSPDTWEVSRKTNPSIIRAMLGSKETSIEPLQEGGVAPRPLPENLKTAFCLAPEQVKSLALLIMAAREHYGSEQEVEWALDSSGRFFLMQSRPLRFSARAEGRDEPAGEVDGHELVVRGAPAAAGCRSGPVFLSMRPDDVGGFPEGAVLVARHSSPEYVKVMNRAAAIVTDVGAVAGHMASLAREFRVPAAFDTKVATSLLADGEIVTVDGGSGAVYRGRAESLLCDLGEKRGQKMRGTPVYKILEEVARLIVPLTMTDPRSPEFSPMACHTIHDLARFTHEKAFEEMFRLSDRVSKDSYQAMVLEARLPFELYLIDLGGGLSRPYGPGKVKPSEVSSLPMSALLRGMSDERLRWWEPKPVSVRGLVSVATESLFGPPGEFGQRRLGDRSYAIIADSYCNFNSRIGYHFTAVDAYCCDTPSRNYISFRFKGGAADEFRRATRCLMIEKILQRLDFQVERHQDLVNARFRKFPPDALLTRLEEVGRLVVATRQLDMRMGAGAPIEWYVEEFFKGNYLFEPNDSPQKGSRGGGS